jgi:F-type H+-transporting ATPase subunit b
MADISLILAAGNPISDVLEPFGVAWPFFISQVILFVLVAVLLRKFAYGPVLAMLEQRRMRISEGEEKLKRIEQQLADSERRTAEAIAKANADANRLVAEAKQSASILTEQKAQEAVAAAKAILTKAEQAARAEREQMLTALRKEFGRLVTTTTAQVTGKVLTADDQRRINEEALTKVEA